MVGGGSSPAPSPSPSPSLVTLITFKASVPASGHFEYIYY